MITLTELINATTWLKPQDHMKVTLWNKSKAYGEEEFEEFEDIELNVKNLAKYGDYFVSDIDIEIFLEDEETCYLVCFIWKDE